MSTRNARPGFWADLYAVLYEDGIELDREEAALLGAPKGETISLWEAMRARHGALGAIVVCALLSVLVQWGHCHKQLAGEPMPPIDAARALICLVGGPALLVLGAVLAWRVL